MSPERNWNTDSFMPDASPELTEIINNAKNPTELREAMLAYYQRKGLAAQDQNRNGVALTGDDPAAHQYSKIVTLPNGHRTMITGARSEAELAAFEAELLKSLRH